MGYDTGVTFSKILSAAKNQFLEVRGQYSGHHVHISKETPCKQ